MLTFPKPSQIKKQPEVERVFADGRTKLNQLTKAGRDEYHRRVRVMWDRQGGRCGLMISPQCKARKGKLLTNEAQFEHSNGRGMGGAKRTDAIVDAQGSWLNMAVCCWCNTLKGSRPLSAFNEIVP